MSAFTSHAELTYGQLSLRSDGRAASQARDVVIELDDSVASSSVASSVAARISGVLGEGDTEVCASVRAEMVQANSSTARPASISVSLDASPATLAFMAQSSLEAITASLSSLCSPACLPASFMHQLSVGPAAGAATRGWALFVDVQVVSADAGGVADAVFCAARAALASVRLPQLVVIGVPEGPDSEGDLAMPLTKTGQSLGLPTGKRRASGIEYDLCDGGHVSTAPPVAWRELPVSVTFCSLDGSWIVDPTLVEERAADSAVALAFRPLGHSVELCFMRLLVSRRPVDNAILLEVLSVAQSEARDKLESLNSRIAEMLQS